MEKHSPRAFANRLELGRDNSQSAGDFPRGDDRPSRYAPAFFVEDQPLSSLQSRMRWGHKTPTSFAKGGSNIFNFAFSVRDRADS